MFKQQALKITLVASTIALTVAVTLIQARADSNKNDYLDDKALVATMRFGGLNLYFRHESTDWSQSDRVHQVDDWLSCDADKMRQLSDTGRKAAIATGQSIKSLGIPIGKVLASPYCRTVETARLMRLGSGTSGKNTYRRDKQSDCSPW